MTAFHLRVETNPKNQGKARREASQLPKALHSLTDGFIQKTSSPFLADS